MIQLHSSKYRYSGRLEETPLPVILKKIGDYKVPGVIQVQNGFALKKLYIKLGRIIFATSNQKDDRLGEFLMARGVINEEQFAEATRRLKANPQKRFGRILVEMGILTPHQLFQSVLQQIEGITLSLFRWREGDITFVIGDYKDEELIKLNLPIQRAIMTGVRLIEDLPTLLKHLGDQNVKYIQTPRLKFEIHELGLKPPERRLLLLLDGRNSIRDILARSPLEELKTVQILYGLKVLERIRPVEPPS